MKCRTVKKRLSAYQDKELKSEEHERVTSHLLSCRDCREQYEELDRVWQTLGKLEGIRPDLWFYPQLVRKIKEPREKGLLPAFERLLQLLRAPVMVFVILVIGITVGSYLGGILARYDLFPSQDTPISYSQEALFTSIKAFDPAPPGTFAEGYLRMVSYKESESR